MHAAAILLGLLLAGIYFSFTTQKTAKKKSITIADYDHHKKDLEREIRVITGELNAIIRRKNTSNFEELVKTYDKRLNNIFDGNALSTERSFRFQWYRALAMVDRMEALSKGKIEKRMFYIDPILVATYVKTLIEDLDELMPITKQDPLNSANDRLRNLATAIRVLRTFWILDEGVKNTESEELMETLGKKTKQMRKIFENEETVKIWFSEPFTKKPDDDTIDAARELKPAELTIFHKNLPEIDRTLIDTVGGLEKMIVIYLDEECMVYTLTGREYLVTYKCDYFEEEE